MTPISKRRLAETLATLIYDDAAGPAASAVAGWNAADQHRLLQLADDEDLLNLAVARLQAHAASATLSAVDKVAARIRQRQQWSTLRISLLHELLRGLAAAGVHTRSIKGFALGQDLYGQAVLRDSHDIDLIVAPRDAHAAAIWLAASGYRPKCDVAWFADQRFLGSLREATFESMGGVLEVDLHWRIDHRWSPQITPVERLLADTSRTMMIGDTHVAWYSPVNVALIQASNIVNSWDAELRSAVDFARSIARLTEREASELVGCFRDDDSLWVLRTLTRVACRVCGVGHHTLPAPIAWVAESDAAVLSRRQSRIESTMVDEALGNAELAHHSYRRHHDNHRFVHGPRQQLRLLAGRVRPGMADFSALPPAVGSTSLGSATLLRRLSALARRSG